MPARESLGGVLGDVGAHGLLASYRSHRAGGALPRHEHGAAYLGVVIRGGHDETAARELACGRGALVAHPPGHVHANRFGAEETRCVNLFFDAGWLQEPEIGGLFDDYRALRVDPHSEALHRIERALQTPDAGSRLAVAAAALDLIGEALRSETSALAPVWLRTVKEAIAADPVEPPALRELAMLARVHPAHLSRAFRKATGETLGGFARRLRLDVAEQWLRHEELSLAEVAAAAGFYDQAHFARAYRRRFGCSPSMGRRQTAS